MDPSISRWQICVFLFAKPYNFALASIGAGPLFKIQSARHQTALDIEDGLDDAPPQR